MPGEAGEDLDNTGYVMGTVFLASVAQGLHWLLVGEMEKEKRAEEMRQTRSGTWLYAVAV